MDRLNTDPIGGYDLYQGHFLNFTNPIYEAENGLRNPWIDDYLILEYFAQHFTASTMLKIINTIHSLNSIIAKQ